MAHSVDHVDAEYVCGRPKPGECVELGAFQSSFVAEQHQLQRVGGQDGKRDQN